MENDLAGWCVLEPPKEFFKKSEDNGSEQSIFSARKKTMMFSR